MTSLQEIEKAIGELPRDKFFKLVRHLRERHGDEWDRQMEQDIKKGGLDRSWKNAEKEMKDGGLKPLDKIFDDPRFS